MKGYASVALIGGVLWQIVACSTFRTMQANMADTVGKAVAETVFAYLPDTCEMQLAYRVMQARYAQQQNLTTEEVYTLYNAQSPSCLLQYDSASFRALELDSLRATLYAVATEVRPPVRKDYLLVFTSDTSFLYYGITKTYPSKGKKSTEQIIDIDGDLSFPEADLHPDSVMMFSRIAIPDRSD